MKLYLSWEKIFEWIQKLVLVWSDLHLRNNQQQQYNPSMVKIIKNIHFRVHKTQIFFNHGEIFTWKNSFLKVCYFGAYGRSFLHQYFGTEYLYVVTKLINQGFILLSQKPGYTSNGCHPCHNLKSRPLWKLKWSPWLHLSSLNYHCVSVAFRHNFGKFVKTDGWFWLRFIQCTLDPFFCVPMKLRIFCHPVKNPESMIIHSKIIKDGASLNRD